jgi:hypothetical protein
MRALSLTAILLMAATGCCLFDTDCDDHHAIGVDLCLGMVATAFGALILVAPDVAGRSSVLRRWTSTPVTIAVLDPPPWSRLSA